MWYNPSKQAISYDRVYLCKSMSKRGFQNGDCLLSLTSVNRGSGKTIIWLKLYTLKFKIFQTVIVAVHSCLSFLIVHRYVQIAK